MHEKEETIHKLFIYFISLKINKKTTTFVCIKNLSARVKKLDDDISERLRERRRERCIIITIEHFLYHLRMML